MKKNSLTLILLSGIILFTVLLVAALTYVSVVYNKNAQQIQADNFIHLLKEEQKNQEKLLEHALLVKVTALADLVAKTAAEPMAAYDTDALDRIITVMESDRDIVNVVFLNPDLSIFTGDKTGEGSFETVKKPIVAEDIGEIGFLEVTFETTSVVENTKELKKRIQATLIGARDSIFQVQKEVVTKIIIFSIIGILLFCFIIYLSLRHIVIKPLKRTVSLLMEIAKGNLTRRLASEKYKELDELAYWINESVKATQTIVGNIKGVSEDLFESSQSLITISGQMQTGAQNTSGNSNSVVESTEALSAKMNSVSSATELVSNNMNIIETSIDEMTRSISEIAEKSGEAIGITGEAVERSRNTSDKTSELGRLADEISKVSDTIADISSLTNLLALNATIEASRAGEAGKGFAVVASEIKDLAGQTANATIEVKKRIGGIQNSVMETVGETGKIFDSIGAVNDIVSSISKSVFAQSATSREITRNVSQAADGIKDVTINIVDSSVTSNEIFNDISIVNQAAAEISSNSSRVKDKADTLSRMARELQKTIGSFNV